MWFKIQIMIKLKNSVCDKTQIVRKKETELWQNSKTENVKKFENETYLKNSYDKTHKTQIVTKLKNSNCEKTQHISMYERKRKLF